jgi:hypothetical protein
MTRSLAGELPSNAEGRWEAAPAESASSVAARNAISLIMMASLSV